MANQKVVSTKRYKIHVSEIEVGMYVAELDIPWVDSTFLYQGFEIESEEQIDELQQQCAYVFVDSLEERDFNPVRHPVIQPGVHAAYSNDVEAEFSIAKDGYQKTIVEVRSLLDEVSVRKTLNLSTIKEYVSECADSISRNPSALLWLTRIKHISEYTAEHCINVGILAMSFGRYLGLSKEDIELLGQCGILHDLGKMKVNQDILNKPGKLTEAEFNHIKNHPLYGHAILMKEGSTPQVVKEAVFSHHERMDGNGYPRGIPAGELSLLTRITSIVDVYDALTSHRCYDKARPPALALKMLYVSKGKHLDEKLVIKFIEFIGIYPIGSLVELNTGEVGVVIETTPEKKLRPKVAILLDGVKEPVSHKVIDLSEQSGPNKVFVEGILPDGAFGINLESTMSMFDI